GHVEVELHVSPRQEAVLARAGATSTLDAHGRGDRRRHRSSSRRRRGWRARRATLEAQPRPRDPAWTSVLTPDGGTRIEIRGRLREPPHVWWRHEQVWAALEISR